MVERGRRVQRRTVSDKETRIESASRPLGLSVTQHMATISGESGHGAAGARKEAKQAGPDARSQVSGKETNYCRDGTSNNLRKMTWV